MQCRTERLAVSFFLIVLLGVLGSRCRMEVRGLGVVSRALQVASPFLLQGSQGNGWPSFFLKGPQWVASALSFRVGFRN